METDISTFRVHAWSSHWKFSPISCIHYETYSDGIRLGWDAQGRVRLSVHQSQELGYRRPVLSRLGGEPCGGRSARSQAHLRRGEQRLVWAAHSLERQWGQDLEAQRSEE